MLLNVSIKCKNHNLRKYQKKCYIFIEKDRSSWYLIEVALNYILQDNDFFSDDGIPKNPFPNGWKGEAGLYAVGFTRKGLFGASLDAMSVAHDIACRWKEESKQHKKTAAARHRRCISHF